jgi:hypothetical protein
MQGDDATHMIIRGRQGGDVRLDWRAVDPRSVSGRLRRKMDAKQSGRIAQACRGSSAFAIGQDKRQVTPEGP